ncbi:MAG: hypothetical protein KDA37_02295, partial [Planctomycetales bacterium]|nr:hypothetical protein [Planctomycetales bacterium]
MSYSGIYPHTAVSNTHYECGIGAIIRRNQSLYFTTYGPHLAAGSTDKLHVVDTRDLSLTTFLDYPGGTHANRYRDHSRRLDLLGAAYLDGQDVIRYLPVAHSGELQGRITGSAAHLRDAHKYYYMTMEEGLYEVDFTNIDRPSIITLRPDGNVDTGGGSHNLPGVHGKGLYTGQGVLLFTNNGGGDGGRGVLAEWNGQGDPKSLESWEIVDKNAQYAEVTSRRGPGSMDPSGAEPIWATGWDDASMFINVREADSARWTKFRLPKASYTHDHPSGWYTEWPRIRDVGLPGGYLMSHHGMLYLVPASFSASNASGVRPFS